MVGQVIAGFDRILLEVDIGEHRQRLQVAKLVDTVNIVAFHVEYSQMFQERNIKKVLKLVERNVQFLQLLKSLNALNFFNLTASQMKHSNVFKTCA